MKFKSIFILVILIAIASCKNSDKSNKLSGDLVTNTLSADGNTGKHPIMTFEKTEHDFGRIFEGEKVTYHFKFKNTGGSDLIVSSAKGSCGCTVPTFTKSPVKPGGDGVISVEFDSNRRSGAQAKAVSVLSNAQPSTVVLTVRALIIEP